MTTQKKHPTERGRGHRDHRILTAWLVSMAGMLVFIPFQIFQKEEDF